MFSTILWRLEKVDAFRKFEKLFPVSKRTIFITLAKHFPTKIVDNTDSDFSLILKMIPKKSLKIVCAFLEYVKLHLYKIIVLCVKLICNPVVDESKQ